MTYVPLQTIIDTSDSTQVELLIAPQLEIQMRTFTRGRAMASQVAIMEPHVARQVAANLVAMAETIESVRGKRR